MAERLVALETADVEVPPPPGIVTRAPLYFRVVALPHASLRVELWELGRPYGARSVSSMGTQGLEARRIALAAAELARQLRERRLLEILAARAEKSRLQAPSPPQSGIPIYGRVAWSGGARAAVVGPSNGWLVGPHLNASLRFSSGPRLTLGSAWLAGRADAVGTSGGARWLEVSLALTHRVPLGPRVDLDVGLEAAIASVRLASREHSSTSSVDTWSARGGALARVEMALGRHVALSVGPDVGAVLRRIGLDGPAGAESQWGGLWVGGTVTAVVDPTVR